MWHNIHARCTECLKTKYIVYLTKARLFWYYFCWIPFLVRLKIYQGRSTSFEWFLYWKLKTRIRVTKRKTKAITEKYLHQRETTTIESITTYALMVWINMDIWDLFCFSNEYRNRTLKNPKTWLIQKVYKIIAFQTPV